MYIQQFFYIDTFTLLTHLLVHCQRLPLVFHGNYPQSQATTRITLTNYYEPQPSSVSILVVLVVLQNGVGAVAGYGIILTIMNQY